ncbi:MAG: ectonucleotide pyrophosphatase/phosphodiesterase [Nibricoccus sp.]
MFRPLAFVSTFLLSFGLLCAAENAGGAPVLLISMDGFRWDYCEKFPAETPTLRHLRETGASARGLIPVFPSNTFPNHYSIATGLLPAHHGIVNNQFFEPTTGLFYYNQPLANRDGHWWGGEPIWITAVKQGKVSACSFWPGSEAEIGGRRATYWKPYDYSIPFEKRVDELFGWLKLPEKERPVVVTFYLEETNSVGHKFGPDSPELASAVKELDAKIGVILRRAADEGVPLNVVIVSDHGMTRVVSEKPLLLDDYVELAQVQVECEGPVVGLRPLTGTADELVGKLRASLPAEARVCRLEELPESFHARDSERYPPVWILMAPGWRMQKRSTYNPQKYGNLRGEHGYDPQFPDMRGILIVKGPAFRNDGAVVDAVENIDVYNLLCAAAELRPVKNDGSDRLVKTLLRAKGNATQR